MNIPYQPIVRAVSGPYRGAALVGTHSAIIGWTLNDPALREGLLGFAIRRTDLDPETGEILRLDWLGGYKRFTETDNGKADDVRSLEAPFQRFRWNDYTLKTTRSYIYEVFPMRGSPTELTRDEPPLRFELRPSLEDTGDLGVFVNRGVTAAKAYLSRFRNQHPSEVGPPAYSWLSRGLKESLLKFIAAANPGESLHVAIYEFFDHEIAQALKDALDRQVGVHIVHDAKPGKRSTKENEEVIHLFGLEGVRTKRTTVNISHNKIVIRLVNNTPLEVWTGSANFSENAFNFQTNMALIVRDTATVKHYEYYFQALINDPPKAKSKLANRQIMDQANSLANRFAEKTFFSPIKEKEILETSVALINSAESIVMISAPFGVDKTMIQALLNNSDDIIEYGLVNSTAKKKIDKLHRKNTRFFTPNSLKTFLGRTWDAKAFGAHKIHAKTIVVDPWSDNPKVFIGSANFSKASCSDNDENALLITGNKRLSSIIATEFMRTYDHYKSRYYIDLLNDRNKG
ncbi:MAG: NgoFVII family restriction endonuclease, partial [Desulfobacteraceae bacterium]|nr:NgoFVII family restriction endonuclease [Desulfobacteraceae bacterium]